MIGFGFYVWLVKKEVRSFSTPAIVVKQNQNKHNISFDTQTALRCNNFGQNLLWRNDTLWNVMTQFILISG